MSENEFIQGPIIVSIRFALKISWVNKCKKI